MNTFTKKKSGVIKQTPRQKLQYVKKNWHLYIVFFNAGFSFDHYLQVHSHEWSPYCI